MSGGKRLSLDGELVSHHSGISCMAEYAVVDRGTIVIVDKSLPLHEASLTMVLILALTRKRTTTNHLLDVGCT